MSNVDPNMRPESSNYVGLVVNAPPTPTAALVTPGTPLNTLNASLVGRNVANPGVNRVPAAQTGTVHQP